MVVLDILDHRPGAAEGAGRARDALQSFKASAASS
jgi:hypothetical protein